MAGWLLQDQPDHPERPEVLHSAHVGAASDPHHGPRHTEWCCSTLYYLVLRRAGRCDHEQPDGLLLQGLHHQEAGQGRHGDRGVHPKYSGEFN